MFNRFGKKPAGNRKVKNAKKVVVDGIKFDSKLEAYCYSEFKRNGIDFDLKPKFTLVETFVYLGKTIRAMTFTPDFALWDRNTIVDTKGFSTNEYKLKEKFLKRYLYDMERQTDIVILKNNTEVDKFIASLKAPAGKKF